MIQISLQAAFLLPLFFCLVMLLILTLYYYMRDRSIYRAPARNKIYRCSICEHVYVDSRGMALAKCPRCGCLNEPVRT